MKRLAILVLAPLLLCSCRPLVDFDPPSKYNNTSPEVVQATAAAKATFPQTLTDVRDAFEHSTNDSARVLAVSGPNYFCGSDEDTTNAFACHQSASVYYALPTSTYATDLVAYQSQLSSLGWGAWPSQPDESADLSEYDQSYSEFSPNLFPAVNEYNAKSRNNLKADFGASEQLDGTEAVYATDHVLTKPDESLASPRDISNSVPSGFYLLRIHIDNEYFRG